MVRRAGRALRRPGQAHPPPRRLLRLRFGGRRGEARRRAVREQCGERELSSAKPSSYARWLGYVPFERLVDNKNDDAHRPPGPVERRPDGACLGRRSRHRRPRRRRLGRLGGPRRFRAAPALPAGVLRREDLARGRAGPARRGVQRRSLSDERPDQRHATCTRWRATRSPTAGRWWCSPSRLRSGGILGHADRHRAQAAGAARSPVPDASTSPWCMRRSAPNRCAISTCRRRR